MSRNFPPIFLVSIKPDQNELLFPATFLIEQNGAIAVSDAAVLFVHFSISDTFISLDDTFTPNTQGEGPSLTQKTVNLSHTPPLDQ